MTHDVVERCESTADYTFTPCVGALLTHVWGPYLPLCGGLTSPLCGGLTSPLCGGLIFPLCGGLTYPLCGGLTSPLCGGALLPPCVGALLTPCVGALLPPCVGALLPPVWGPYLPPVWGPYFPPMWGPYFPCVGALLTPCVGALLPPCVGALFPPAYTPGLASLRKTEATWGKTELHCGITLAMCTITCHAFSSKQPAYLHSMLTPARQPRQLRLSGSNLRSVPRVKTNAGTRAFSVAAPTLWNSLLVSVKSAGNTVSFPCHLRTYLFNIAYPP